MYDNLASPLIWLPHLLVHIYLRNKAIRVLVFGGCFELLGFWILWLID
jgi:hypothetical protein